MAYPPPLYTTVPAMAAGGYGEDQGMVHIANQTSEVENDDWILYGSVTILVSYRVIHDPAQCD
jgi:hypothetical protein